MGIPTADTHQTRKKKDSASGSMRGKKSTAAVCKRRWLGIEMGAKLS